MHGILSSEREVTRGRRASYLET